VRTLGQSYDQQDFEEIVLLSSSDGTVVRLRDVADVRAVGCCFRPEKVCEPENSTAA